jgi:tRNA pseudouridine55 synthase
VPPLTRAPQTCSKGTYIRSLAHDLGAALGTHAHLTELRRVSIGDHAVDNAWPLEALIAAANAAAAEATVV